MLKSKSHIFRENRLVFLNEKPAGSPSESTKKPTSPGESLFDKAKNRFTEAKREAFKSVQAFLKPSLENTPPKPTATAEVKPLTPQPEALPKLPEKPAGLHIDAQKTQINPDKKEVTHHFQFGDDKKISGHITMPTDSTPDGKTTYVFHYSDHPDQQDNKDLLTQLQKHRDKLGNTVVITLQTPTGETVVDGKKVESLTHLLGSLEAFQKQAQNDPRLKGLQLPVSRASNIFHLASTPEDQTKAASLLDNLLKKPQSDSRFTKDTRPHDLKGFIKILEQASQNPPSTPISRPVQTTGGQYSDGGGRLSGRVSTGGSESHTPTPDSPKPTVDNRNPGGTPIETPSHIRKPPEGIEKVGPLKGYFGFFGDSITVSEQKSGYFDKSKFSTGESPFYLAKGAQTSEWLLNNLKTIPETELSKMKNAVVLIGTNDIGGMGERYSAEAIIKRIKTIHDFFLNKGITVYACTIPPFKGHNFSTYRSKYDEVNKKRNAINDAIMADKRLKIIPLHQSEAQGGIASEDGESISENYLVKYGNTIDYVHPQPRKLANLVESYIKSDQYKTDSSKKTPASPEVTRDSSIKGKPYRESTPEFNAWATRINLDFIESGAPFGATKTVYYKGKPLLAQHVSHTQKGSTGETGNFKATEIFEYNESPNDSKKKPEALSTNSEVERLTLDNGKVSSIIDYPPNFDPSKTSEVIIYTTPDGSDAERSYGEGDKIKEQISLLRKNSPQKNIIGAIIAAETKNWSNYSSRSMEITNTIINHIQNTRNIPTLTASLDSHSGGGHFLIEMLRRGLNQSPNIHSLNFFDSLYWYGGKSDAQIIVNWLKSNQSNTFTSVAGTPPILSKHNELINNLNTLGVKLSPGKETNLTSEQTAFNGRLKIITMKTKTHSGTIKWNGLIAAHDPNVEMRQT